MQYRLRSRHLYCGAQSVWYLSSALILYQRTPNLVRNDVHFAPHPVQDEAFCGTVYSANQPQEILVATDFHRRHINMPVREALACKSDLSALWKSALPPLEMRFLLFTHEQNCSRDPTGAYSKRGVIAYLSKGAILAAVCGFYSHYALLEMA